MLGPSRGSPNGPFLPPWCLLGCPLSPFLLVPPWRLQLVLSASLVLPRLSKWSFPASLVPRRLSN